MPRSDSLQRRFPPAPLLATTILLALAAGCTQGPDPPETAREGDGETATLIYGSPEEPRELNCIRASDLPAIQICHMVHDTLLAFGKDLDLQPRLAESWEIGEGGRSITFRLRRGAAWHDGAPFASRDVLYTVQQIRHPDAMIRGNLPALFEPLESIEAPDDYTVVARYREPYAPALQAWARAYILPAHLPASPGATSPEDRAPVGTGPFRFESWDPAEKITLAANEEYFGGRPLLDRLILRIIPDAHTLALALQTGEAHLGSLPPPLAPPEKPGAAYRVHRFSSLKLDFILWNARSRPGIFADSRVRRALSMALDRAGYIEHVTGGADRAAVSTFHPAIWAHDPSLEPLPYDPAEAASLLKQAGWSTDFTLLYYSGNRSHEKIATLLQDALGRLGISVSLQGLEWTVFLEKVRGGSFDAAVYRWNLDPDPDPFDFFHSSQAEGGQNYGGYSSPVFDRLAEEARRTPDPAARRAIYHRIERILREDQPYTFISHPASVAVVSRRLEGVEFGPSGFWGWYPAQLQWRILPGESGPDR